MTSCLRVFLLGAFNQKRSGTCCTRCWPWCICFTYNIQNNTCTRAGEGASLLRCAALAAQATKYPDLQVASVFEEVDGIAAEVRVCCVVKD